jgi:hypothetical protein
MSDPHKEAPPQVELLAEMLKQIAQDLEQTKEELAQLKETVHQKKEVQYPSLPKTDLVSHNFWTRAAAVFGYWFLMMGLTSPFWLCLLWFLMLFYFSL